MCGTDREIAEGLFGVAPDGEERLVLGHELLGRVERDGHGFARGDLVTATVRRSCGHCAACARGRAGRLRHRGLPRARHHAAARVRRASSSAEAPEHLVPVPAALGRARRAGRAGVDLRARAAPRPRGRRPPAVGTRGARSCSARARSGCSAPTCCGWTASRSGRPRSSRAGTREGAAGRRPAGRHATSETPLRGAREAGGFDVVLEAAGDAQLMLDTLGLLRRNGVACLLGIDGHDQVGRPDRAA